MLQQIIFDIFKAKLFFSFLEFEEHLSEFLFNDALVKHLKLIITEVEKVFSKSLALKDQRDEFVIQGP